MKSVLLSVKPELAQRVIEGRQKILLKMSQPRIETPFKCYLYCKHGKLLSFSKHAGFSFVADCSPFITTEKWLNEPGQLNGRIFGEFVCEFVRKVNVPMTYIEYIADPKIDEILFEANVRKAWPGIYYVWHITDFKLYDELKELSEFKRRRIFRRKGNGFKALKRAPLNYCIVEKTKDDNE